MGGVIEAIVDVVEAIVEVIVDVVVGIVDFVGDVIGFVLNPFGAFGGAGDVADPGAAAQGVTVTRNGSNVPIPVVYGHRKLGGANIFTETNGVENANLYVVYALCEGEIQGLHKIFVNDIELPRTGQDYPIGTEQTVTEGRYANRISFQFFNGTETQSQSSLANQSASWGSKRRRLPGVAYVVMRFYWAPVETQDDVDANPFGGGIPQVNFEVFGKKVYDVTTHGSGENLSGSYANRTKTYSTNPSNCFLDYLENPRYGAGQATDTINAETFKIAANKFNQTVSYSNNQSGRAMTMHAVVDTSQQVINNSKLLLTGCRSIFPWVNGRYKLKVEDGGHPTDISSATVNVAYDVDANEIIGGVKLVGERKSSKYNRVIVNYIDPDKAFSNQQVTFERAGDLARDNNEILVNEFTFHTLTNAAVARDIAQMIYDKSRTQSQISFVATQELLDVEVGDIITVTDDIVGLSGDTYRVVGMKLKNDLTLDIEAVEHDATLYPFVTGEQIEIPPPIYLPDYYNLVPMVSNLPQFPVGIVHVYDDLINDYTNPNPPTSDPALPVVAGGGGTEVDPPSQPAPWDPGEITAPPDGTPGAEEYYDNVYKFWTNWQQPGVGGYWGNSSHGSYNDYIEFGHRNGNRAVTNDGNSGVNIRFRSVAYSNQWNFATEPLSVPYQNNLYRLFINAPTDGTINGLRITAYENGLPTQIDDVEFRTLTYRPSNVKVGTGINFTPRSANTNYRVWWIKDINGPGKRLFADDSDFTTMDSLLPSYIKTDKNGVSGGANFFTEGYTFRNENGVIITSKGMEGLLNFLVHHYYNVIPRTSTTKRNSHSLGG